MPSAKGASWFGKGLLQPEFTLVHGGARALEIAASLGAHTLIPLANGDIAAEGVRAPFVQADGSQCATLKLARRKFPGIAVLNPAPGESLCVDTDSSVTPKKNEKGARKDKKMKKKE